MESKWMDVIAGIVGGVLGAVLGFWGFIGGLGIELYGAYKGEGEKYSRWGISLMSGGIAGMLHGGARKYGMMGFWSAFDYNQSLTDRFKALLNYQSFLQTVIPQPTTPSASNLVQTSTGGISIIS